MRTVFFVETEEQAMFKRLGHLKMLKENFLYLYPLPNKPTEWRMGYGRNKDDIKEENVKYFYTTLFNITEGKANRI